MSLILSKEVPTQSITPIIRLTSDKNVTSQKNTWFCKILANFFLFYKPLFFLPWDRPEAPTVLLIARRDSGSCRRSPPIVPTVPPWKSSCGDVFSWSSGRRSDCSAFDKDERYDRESPIDCEMRLPQPSPPRNPLDIGRDMPQLKRHRHYNVKKKFFFFLLRWTYVLFYFFIRGQNFYHFWVCFIKFNVA